MRAFNRYAFVVLILAAAGSAPGRIRVTAQVDTARDIYLGESFTYHVVIEGDNKPGQVDISPLAQYNPQSAGNRDYSQTSINIVNGKTTQTVSKRLAMSYTLTATKECRMELPPITVRVDGQSYQTNAVSVNVMKPGKTDRIDLEVTLSEQRCYVGQPVIMTVKFYVPQDVGDFRFNIPAFNSGLFLLEDPELSNRQVRQFDLGNGVTVLVSQHRVSHNGRQMIALVFSKVLIAKRAGDIELEPVRVSANLPVGKAKSRRRGFFDDFMGSRTQYKRFMVGSKPMKLTVMPLPAQGKPPGFYGLVGRHTISASATPTTEVYMGDPITLAIKIGGGKYLKSVQWPRLEEVPLLAANFKIPTQKASPEIVDGFKVFTQTIRPDNNQANQIPPIPLAYFDPDKGEYVVANTKPIKLDLIPSKRLTTADMEGHDLAPMNKEVEAIKKGLSANYEGLDALKNMDFSPAAAIVSPGYAAVWGLPLAAMILSAAIRISTQTSPEKAAAKRRHRARPRALTRLKTVASGSGSERHELLASAMKQYIGERFDRVAGSLTGDDCFEAVAEATGNNHTAQQYKELIAECEAARYSSAEANVDAAQIRKAAELIHTIEKESKK